MFHQVDSDGFGDDIELIIQEEVATQEQQPQQTNEPDTLLIPDPEPEPEPEQTSRCNRCYGWFTQCYWYHTFHSNPLFPYECFSATLFILWLIYRIIFYYREDQD